MTDTKNVKPETTKYSLYKRDVQNDINQITQEFCCQPILFIGSGLPKRYFGAPNWDELLAHLAESCSEITKGLGFYKQLYQTPQKIGEEFAKIYQEWAWSKGHNKFPDDMFGDDVDSQSYIKFKIAEHLQKITPKTVEAMMTNGHRLEIEALKKIKPHALISTNYDTMLETIFPDHQPIIGQQILRGNQVAVGEVYKIHGCVTEHNSVIFTETDYQNFTKKKKFLSAKLLTFFNEHPLIFIGYSASDPNIKAILSDIDEALPVKGDIIPNVYILEWNQNLTQESSPARERVILTEEDRSIRVKLIEANDFTWVFETFAANPALQGVNPRTLRALIARSYSLVRHDIPKMKVDADFKMLTTAVEDSAKFATLFGIANINNYSVLSAQYPYSPRQLGIKLGGDGWHLANKLIDQVKLEKGLDLRASDNRYHRAEQSNKTKLHKYSEEAVILLKKVKKNSDYEVVLP